MFVAVKEQLERNYKDWSLNAPYEHASFYCNYALQDYMWHSDEKLEALQGLSLLK